MSTALAPSRPPVSEEFVLAHRRARILQGLAKAIAEKGYCECKVADIVRSARCARNTFYGFFGSKASASIALLDEVCPPLGEIFAGSDPSKSPGALLAVELSARWWSGEEDEALAATKEGEQIVRWLAGSALKLAPLGADDSLQGSLPPGRHGLPREFVRANQRQRLISGLAGAVAEHGFMAATVADITSHAAVSRRTFYEHFFSKEAAALAMVSAASSEAGDWLKPTGAKTALGIVGVEIVADRCVGSDVVPTPRASVLSVLTALRERFEEGEPGCRS